MPDSASPDRNALRALRRAVPAPVRIAAAEAVAQRLLDLEQAPRAGHVAGYWAMDGELPLHAWQVQLPAACVYCLPVLDAASKRLRFAPWRAGEPLATNRFGIPEPDLDPGLLLDARDMALIALPLTGFDARGHRLGMGGGWYDRSLAFRAGTPAPPLLVGIGFDLQEVAAIAPRSWDIRCDAIVTETRTLLTAST